MAAEKISGRSRPNGVWCYLPSNEGAAEPMLATPAGDFTEPAVERPVRCAIFLATFLRVRAGLRFRGGQPARASQPTATDSSNQLDRSARAAFSWRKSQCEVLVLSENATSLAPFR